MSPLRYYTEELGSCLSELDVQALPIGNGSSLKVDAAFVADASPCLTPVSCISCITWSSHSKALHSSWFLCFLFAAHSSLLCRPPPPPCSRHLSLKMSLKSLCSHSPAMPNICPTQPGRTCLSAALLLPAVTCFSSSLGRGPRGSGWDSRTSV